MLSYLPPELLVSSKSLYCSATTSISTSASLGNAATPTVEREGAAFVKKRPYTSFIAAKSEMFLRNTVVHTTRSMLLPAVLSTADRFLSTRSVCAFMSPSTSLPVAGSRAI